MPVSLARRHKKKNKNGMLQLYQQIINTVFTSIVCNWKKVQFHKLMEDNEIVDLHKKVS